MEHSHALFRCPECKQKAGVKIVYGYPSEELFEQAERDEVALGGWCRSSEHRIGGA